MAVMITLPMQAQNVITALEKKGYEAYAIGGSVRDILMGRNTHGWDFTTNATPEQILEVFPDSFYDNQFGTVGIKIYETGKKRTEEEKPEDIYEITTYRSEQGYEDHRHPDKITWGKTLLEDLSRRDFTINAIAYDGKTLIDPHGGEKDLKNKIIKTVGNPDLRFAEDALRIMRSLRIASELGFMIEPETLEAIKKHTTTLSKISSERIRDELLRLLGSPFASDGILLMKSTGILKVILPELDEAFAIGQKSPKRHHMYDVGTHCVMALKHCTSPDPIVRLATLLHDIGKVKTYKKDSTGLITFFNHEVVGARQVKEIGYRLRLSKKQIEKIYTLVRWHQFTVDEGQTDAALRRFIRHVGKENVEDMLALRIGDRLGGGARETSWRLELFKKRLEEVQQQPFSVSDLKVDGHDVMKELGVKPGPIIGNTLNALFAEVEAGTLPNERVALLTKMKNITFSSSPSGPTK
jgi:tRNA nucleotidyltransferase (CCA-adding enzyme)